MGRHHTIVITGLGHQRRARVLDIVATFPPPERDAASMLRAFWEQAQFAGYTASSFERGYGKSHVDMTVPERACHARKRLNWYRERLPPGLWAVIWYRLFAEEVDALVAARLAIPQRYVRLRLRSALQTVAELRHAPR